MATRQASVKTKRASAKDRLAKHRQKLYSNPELHDDYRRRERERYQKRKESGKIKSTKDLTKKQHEKKKKQWRKNSANYYRRKKQEKAVLDLTPASSVNEAENSFANAETNRHNVNLNCDNLNQTPPSEVSLDLTGPTEASTPQRPQHVMKKGQRLSKLVYKLRAKLRYAEEKVVAKARELQKLNRRIRRLEARRPQRTMSRLPVQISERARKATKGLPNNSKRRQLGKVVSMFLHRDDVSTVINGKFGEMRRKGQIYRKRALTDTLANLHRRFCAEHPETHVSKAQFFKLRPFWVVRPKVQDRETCACKMHENIGLKVKKLKQLGMIETASPEDLVQSCVCDINNMSCMYGTCENCKGKTFLTSIDPLTQCNIVTWKEWVTKSVSISKRRMDGSTEEKEVKKTLLENKNCSIEKLLALTTEHLPRFKIHLFNIRHQFLTLKSMKETLTDDTVAVHVDYSENYSCKYSREIKETHFGKGNEQVTLHTGVTYLSRGRVETFASLSPCLQHDAVATWAHLNPVLRTIREKYPEAKNVHFISDGPTSQYRNRTFFYLASTVPFLHGFQWVTWNYTEASHGKGAPDGVGGALKNLADRVVSYGTSIPDADSLYEQLENNSSVILYKVSEAEIKASSEMVPPNLKSVPGTMKIHQLTSTKPGVINTRPVSCFCEKDCNCFSPSCHALSEEGEEGPNSTENPDNTTATPSVQAQVHCDATLTVQAQVHCKATPEAQAQVCCEATPFVQTQVHCEATPPLQIPQDVVPEVALEIEMEAEAPDLLDFVVVSFKDLVQVPVRQRATCQGKDKEKEPRPQPKLKRNKKKKEEPCTICHYAYGDREDPKKEEDWLSCTACSRWYHETCAEENGVLDDDASLTCIDCLFSDP